MKRIAFRRHGFADLVRLSTDSVYLEYFHLSGYVSIAVLHGGHWKTVFRGKTGYSGEQPLFAYAEIEELIRVHTGEVVLIEPQYVEAYTLVNKKPIYSYTANDRRFFKGLCVEGLTVREVRSQVDLDFRKDFPYYSVEAISERIDREDSIILDMLFVDVITELHEGMMVSAKDVLVK